MTEAGFEELDKLTKNLMSMMKCCWNEIKKIEEIMEKERGKDEYRNNS